MLAFYSTIRTVELRDFFGSTMSASFTRIGRWEKTSFELAYRKCISARTTTNGKCLEFWMQYDRQWDYNGARGSRNSLSHLYELISVYPFVTSCRIINDTLEKKKSVAYILICHVTGKITFIFLTWKSALLSGFYKRERLPKSQIHPSYCIGIISNRYAFTITIYLLFNFSVIEISVY